MFKRASPETIARARRLRRDASDAEKQLWWWKLGELNSQGHHFRRQSPFDRYILDLVDHEARLVIELDGSQHAETAHRTRDARRDAFLASQGYRTKRFWNREIFENIEGVVAQIVSLLPKADPTPPPVRRRALRERRATSPQRGR